MSLTFDGNLRGAIRSLSFKGKSPAAFTSSTGLDSNQVYTSDWGEAVDYDKFRGIVYISGSEIGEVIGGSFEVQQSFNTGSNVELTSSTYNVSNNAGVSFEETIYARYVRLVYTNNASSGSALNTGSFVVQSYFVG